MENLNAVQEITAMLDGLSLSQLIAIAICTLEVLLRSLPTTKNYSLLRFSISLLQLFEKKIPNIQKTVRKEKHGEGVIEIPETRIFWK